MAKILHCADLHLDSAFHGLPPTQAKERRQAQRELTAGIVELANLNGCDLVLLPGDLFDGHRVFPETLDFVTKAFATCNCPIVIAPGNHDYMTPKSPYALPIWSDNVYIFTENSIKSFDFPEINTIVWGAAFTAATAPALLHSAPVIDPSRINIGVLHGDFQGKNSVYNPISREEIEHSGLDYLALGHVHKASIPEKIGGTWLAYSGCAMGRGFDELGEKGAYLGDISKDSCQLQFFPFNGIIYDIMRINLDNNKDLILKSLENSDFKNRIVRLILEGTSGDLDLQSLAQTLAPNFHALTIRDCTRPAKDIWAEAGENSLKGLFLQELQQFLAENPQDTELAAQFGLAIMEGQEVPGS